MANKLLSTSLLVACMVTTSLSASIAFASEPELYFYPKNSWVVEKTILDKNAQQSCTVSNRFNNGFIMQLAGTDEGFTNINIDFRQDIFDENTRYEVQYSVPGIIEALIPTKSFQKNLLVSDLSSNKAFSDALRSVSVVDMKIRDNDFRFYLTGLESTMKAYNECVGLPKTVDIKANNSIESEVLVAHEEQKIIPRQPELVKGAGAPAPPFNITDTTDDVDEKPIRTQASLRPKPSGRPRYTEVIAQKLKDAGRALKGSTSPEKGNQVAGKANETAPTDTASTPPKEFVAQPEKISAETDKGANKQTQTGEQKIAGRTITIETHSSPPMKVSKETSSMNADFTQTHIKDPIIKEEIIIVQKMDATSLQNIEPSVGVSDDNFIQMRNKISELEEIVSILAEKNILIDEELKISLQDAEKERLAISSENWDLERATMKFNESERQINRLGRQIQSQQAQCRQEKNELEAMLFDPQLTDQKQLATLSSLENDVIQAKSDLYIQQRKYEERIRLLEEKLKAQ